MQDEILAQIKSHIKDIKDANAKNKPADQRHQMDALMQQEKVLTFQIDEVSRGIVELESVFKNFVSVAKDEEILRWNADLPEMLKTLESIADKYQKILHIPTKNTDIVRSVSNIGKRYENLITLKQAFIPDVKRHMSQRELDKNDIIKESRLNIKLAKFSGYNSQLDIYTFQNEFEKLHIRTATKRILPDLLINNYLSEPAFSLVNGLDDIEEIWKRLKATYGDTRMLLAKKVDALGGNSLSRIKDPEKLVTRISQIINTMRDLLKLASKHKIEKHLFYGDAIERIYKTMGEHRKTRWLEQSCEEDLAEKSLWNKLIIFLEKEVKIQQRKMMLQKSKNDENPREAKDKNDRTRYNNKSFHFDFTPICFIYGEKAGESNHIATYGPGGSKIFQHFSCKQFVEKTPAERCSLLRSKGYCIQCLLPGALYSEGKHRDGKCQRDFTCPNQSHHRFHTRKHILVCDEHKDATENNDLLEKYKSRFIVKNTLTSIRDGHRTVIPRRQLLSYQAKSQSINRH